MINFELKNKLTVFLKITIPFGIWCWLFMPIFLGQAVISSETLHIYSVVKFYIDNLKLGVFPLWDPFVMWGAPTQIFLNYAGTFNPLWLLTLALNSGGLSFYQSFLCSISLYFWIGQLGFYLLAKVILKDSRAAYLAFLLFLFSSTSMSMFAQFHPPLLYVPGVWFFYFLFSFLRNQSRWTLTGLIFAAALMLTSYLPFYFITVFAIVGILMGLFYAAKIQTTVVSIIRFICAHIGLALVLCGVLVVAFLPGYYAYQSTVNQEVVAPFRYGTGEKDAGVDFVDYDKVAKNGFASRMDFEDIYANLDIIQYGDDCFFYISIFFYVALIFGATVRMDKVLAVCLLTALLLFLLIMSAGTEFHRFVFEHIFYFKLIRNMHFFLPFFMMVVVLLVAAQLRSLFASRSIILKKYPVAFIIFVILVHAGLVIFLTLQQYIVASSFWALGLSFLFWALFVLDKERKADSLLMVLLFLSIIVQPCEVMWRHNQRGKAAASYPDKALIENSLRIASVKPVFVYTRPISAEVIGNDHTAKARITMCDMSRFYENGFPTFWSYHLTRKESLADLQNYTENKFYVYDAVKVLENNSSWPSLSDYLKLKHSVALVSLTQDSPELMNLMAKSGQGLSKPVSVIRESSEFFRVTSFDVNSIKIQTHYDQEKFLVYTDSYHKDWQAFINGQPVMIYRASVAFKGIRLPPGVNEVYLRYRPLKVMVVSMALVIVLLLTLLFLFWQVATKRVATK